MSLPSSTYVRLRQLIPGKRHTERPALLPFSESTLWRLTITGQFPAPVKLSERLVAWKTAEVQQWLDGSWKSN